MRLSRIYILLLLLSLATGLQARLQNLVINELMAANVSYMLDDTYNYGGWVELYNNSRKSINLAGYSLSDDASNPRKYEFFHWAMFGKLCTKSLWSLLRTQWNSWMPVLSIRERNTIRKTIVQLLLIR